LSTAPPDQKYARGSLAAPQRACMLRAGPGSHRACSDCFVSDRPPRAAALAWQRSRAVLINQLHLIFMRESDYEIPISCQSEDPRPLCRTERRRWAGSAPGVAADWPAAAAGGDCVTLPAGRPESITALPASGRDA